MNALHHLHNGYIWMVAILTVLCSPPPASGSTLETSAAPMHLCTVGDTVFFSADDQIHGRELWHCDALGSATLMTDLQPGPEGSTPTQLKVIGNYLYFQTTTPSYGSHVCFLDLTDHTVINLTKQLPELMGAQILILLTTDTHVYFCVVLEDRIFEVWRSQAGSLTGEQLYSTSFASEIRSNHTYIMRPVASCMSILVENGLDLWGDEDGPLYEISYPEDFSVYEVLGGVTADNIVYAVGGNSEYGRELFRLSLKDNSCALLRDIFPGEASSNISQTALHGNVLFFSATDGICGQELWRSDGTPEGTHLVADIAPGGASSGPYKFCFAGDTLFYVAENDAVGTALWQTDGTEAGSRLVCDLNPGPKSTALWSLAAFQGQLLFCAESAQYGQEVFVSAGTPETTRILRDIVPGAAGSGPHNITPAETVFFFTCDDGVHGEELWVSDGTASGTRLAANIALPKKIVSSYPEHPAAFKDTVVFSANSRLYGREPWQSDGTEAGTRLLLDIAPGKSCSNPGPFVRWEDRLYFAAETPDQGRELWTTEGTSETTQLVADLEPGPTGAAPELITVHENNLYFKASRGRQVTGLWRLFGDGKRLEPIPGLAVETHEIKGLSSLWNRLYIVCADDQNNTVLYRLIDSSENAPYMAPIHAGLHDLQALLDSWEGAGSEGNFMDSLVSVILPINRIVSGETQQNIPLYFVGYTAAYGTELWRSDGTPSGTRLVRDIYPGPPSSGPDQLVLLNERLYFIAEMANEGRVLFVSDGTWEGTVPVYINDASFVWPPLKTRILAACETGLLAFCILPARGAREGPYLILIHPKVNNDHFMIPLLHFPQDQKWWPKSFTGITNQFFFTCPDEEHGTELWVSDTTAAGTHLVKDIDVSQ